MLNLAQDQCVWSGALREMKSKSTRDKSFTTFQYMNRYLSLLSNLHHSENIRIIPQNWTKGPSSASSVQY